MSSQTLGDDGSIPDAANLLRRIHPTQVVIDANTGSTRPSSAAFRDPNMSVDVEHILNALGLDWRFSLGSYPGHSLVRFLAGAARSHGQAVVPLPIAGKNEAHAEVRGKKTPGIANRLRDASSWTFIATDSVPVPPS
jgi:hypothetical protein